MNTITIILIIIYSAFKILNSFYCNQPAEAKKASFTAKSPITPKTYQNHLFYFRMAHFSNHKTN